MNLNRRQFLKVLGLGVAVATVAPTIIIEEIVKKTYNFIPGDWYRHAVVLNQSVKSMSIEKKHQMMSMLDEWLRERIHSDYLDFSKVEYVFQDADYEYKGGLGIDYKVPEKSISKINRKKIDSFGIKLRGIDL